MPECQMPITVHRCMGFIDRRSQIEAKASAGGVHRASVTVLCAVLSIPVRPCAVLVVAVP